MSNVKDDKRKLAQRGRGGAGGCTPKRTYVVNAESISSLLKLSSGEPKSCKYKQSWLLQGWTNKSIVVNKNGITFGSSFYKRLEQDEIFLVIYHISQPWIAIFWGSKTCPADTMSSRCQMNNGYLTMEN